MWKESLPECAQNEAENVKWIEPEYLNKIIVKN